MQVLARHCQTDGHLDSREIADLYVFMAQMELDVDERAAVRSVLRGSGPSLHDLLDRLVVQAEPMDRDVVRFSILKDLVRVSSVDGTVSDAEVAALMQSAALLYETLERATDSLALARKLVEQDAAVLRGSLSGSLLIEQAKLLARAATTVGVPLAALYFSGSVVGLGAIGITSGLAALGAVIGGVVVGPMVSGIVVLVALGAAAGGGANWLLNLRRMSAERLRDTVRLGLAAANQKAISALAEDGHRLESELVRLEDDSRANRDQIDALRRDIQALSRGIATLEAREHSDAA